MALLLGWGNYALGQESIVLSKPSIMVGDSPELKDKTFSFQVKMYANPSDKRNAILTVI